MKKGCIVYLTRSCEKDLNDLQHSLSLLKRNYLDDHPTDVIILHEADIDHIALETAVGDISSVTFGVVDFHGVPGLNKHDAGYRHMCHFFGNDLFFRPELKPYKYYMRQDTDSEILSPIKVDVFDYMEDHGYVYGYVAILDDQPCFCADLWSGVAAYLARNPDMKTYKTLYDEIEELKIFYNNLELCDLEWFRGEAWQSFFTEIDRLGGIYQYRWGDAPLRYLGVNLFADPDKVCHIKNIHYRHIFEYNNPTTQ